MAQQMTFEAANKGARVIVLPELCFSGFVLQNLREASHCAQVRDGYQTQALLEIAKSHNCYITFGYVELRDGKLYNSAATIGPNGILSNVQKHNLVGSDNLWAHPSEGDFPVALTPAGRLGTLVCRDAMNNYRESYAHFNKDNKFYRPGSCDTIALVTNWGAGFAYPDNDWIELAEATGANVIVSNRVGNERDIQFKGGSAVVSRDKKIWTNGSNFTHEAVVGGVVIL
jgi:predicted amidohydrolase